MVDKYKKCDFGRCPRVICEGQGLLPMGLNDNSGVKSVKLYCPRYGTTHLNPVPSLSLLPSLYTDSCGRTSRCEDIYNPKSSKHAAIDGAYFGTSFHNMLFQVYPALIPTKSRRRYEPKIFGFKVHAAAALARWQDEYRRGQRERLMEAGIGMTDATSAQIGGATGNGSGAGGADAKVQKLYVEDEESDDGMAEVEAEARERREQAAAAGWDEDPTVKMEGGA